jgi:hypothetical protein
MGVVAAMSGCQSEAKERPPLPPPPVVRSAEPEASAAPAAPVVPPNFKRKFEPPELKYAACVKTDAPEGMVATACPAGAVVFGPYAAAPQNSTVSATFVVEGLAGATTLFADLVSAGGSKVHAWAGKHALKKGERVTLEFGTEMSASVTDFETRLWSESKDSDLSFKIVEARIEIRGP